jgi:MFS family permease
MGDQDAAIFHRYAEYLWRRAGGIVVRWTSAGALLGAALGAVMLTPWGDWPLSRREVYLVIALGAVSGGFLGRSMGATKALGLRLQAELAQHQLQFERFALAQGQMLPEPRRPAAYAPSGAPPVSAPEPFEAEVPVDLLPASYGWHAIEPAAS